MDVNHAVLYAKLGPPATALALIETRLRQLAGAFGDPRISARLEEAVPGRARQLLNELQSDDRDRARAAGQQVLLMFFTASAPSSTWWGTPLGKLIFHALYRANEPRAVSTAYTQAAAAELLGGISRQRVNAMVNAGQLQRHPDGGVTAASVDAAVRARAGQ